MNGRSTSTSCAFFTTEFFVGGSETHARCKSMSDEKSTITIMDMIAEMMKHGMRGGTIIIIIMITCRDTACEVARR